MYFKFAVCFFLVSVSLGLSGQSDTIESKLVFELDYRFRAEQDWDSKKSDGSLRGNRSRLRYRLRTGASYTHHVYSVGVRLRTGDPNKQQDPQLTLGKGLKEFGTLPIGFEKAYFQFNKNNYKFWLGKNNYPFDKNNELFWSDNVFPEGVMLDKTISLRSDFIENIKFIAGHFILGSNDGSLSEDAYFQGLQTSISARKINLKVFPALYLIRNIPEVPDGNHSYLLDYTIVHIGAKLNLLSDDQLSLDMDYYHNIEDYSASTDIDPILFNQKSGLTFGVQYGNLKEKNDWVIKLTYANLERYAILDYVAQNDWARWDYSSFNSPDGRLSNFQGFELVLGYAFTDKMNIVSKYYMVEQIIPYGSALETGQRIRFDVNIKM